MVDSGQSADLRLVLVEHPLFLLVLIVWSLAPPFARICPLGLVRRDFPENPLDKVVGEEPSFDQDVPTLLAGERLDLGQREQPHDIILGHRGE